MRRREILLLLIVLSALCPCVSHAAPEIIKAVPISIDLPDECTQHIGETSIAAEWATAVSVSPTTDHCWFAARSIACCGPYYWYSDSPEWSRIIVDFPPKAGRRSWCGACVVPLGKDRCTDFVVPMLAFEYTYPGFRESASIAVSPTDGTVWVAEPAQIIRLDSSGAIMWQVWDYANPSSISLDTRDGSCWVADTENNAIVHLSGSGTVMWRGTGFNVPESVSVNRTDGSVWVADTGNYQVAHLSTNGAELWRGSPTAYPVAVAANSVDGSVWVADPQANQVIHLDSQGGEMRRVGVVEPRALAVNTTHSDVWVAGTTLAHLNPDGSVRDVYPISGARSLSVNTRDNSVWVANYDGNEVTQLAPVCTPFCDIDCWFWAVNEIVACYDAQLVQGYHETNSLGEGTTVYHWERIVTRDQMAVYIARALAGGDAFVPDAPGGPLHFKDLLHSGWATKYIEYCYSQNVVQGYPDGTYRQTDPVNRAQMAVYVARAIVEPHGEEGLATWTPPPEATFPDVAASFWAYKHTEYCAGQGVVKGYADGKYHPEILVTRDQMAVYICRALQLPTPAGSAGSSPT